MAQRIEDEISYKIIGAAIEVHRTLGGPGLLESIYESSLCHELTLIGLQIQKQIVMAYTELSTIYRFFFAPLRLSFLCVSFVCDSKILPSQFFIIMRLPCHILCMVES